MKLFKIAIKITSVLLLIYFFYSPKVLSSILYIVPFFSWYGWEIRKKDKEENRKNREKRRKDDQVSAERRSARFEEYTKKVEREKHRGRYTIRYGYKPKENPPEMINGRWD